MGLRKQKFFILALLFFFMMDHPAYCYIDPGTGSYVLQILIAAFLGVTFAIKMFWQRIKSFFSGIFRKGRGE
jgi:hypothetical protein